MKTNKGKQKEFKITSKLKLKVKKPKKDLINNFSYFPPKFHLL